MDRYISTGIAAGTSAAKNTLGWKQRASVRVPGLRARFGQTRTPIVRVAEMAELSPDIRDEVLAAGGKCVGQLVTIEIHGAGTITLIYMTDPEGNIIELQKWT